MNTLLNLFFRWSRKSTVCIAMVIPMLALAQSQSSADSCPPAPMPLEQQIAYVTNARELNAGYLWRIEKEGRTSWLYGTMHFNHIDYAKPGPLIRRSMFSSDVLAVEINFYAPPVIADPSTRTTFKLSDGQLEKLRMAYAKDCLTFNVQGTTELGLIAPLIASQAQRVALYAGYSPDMRLPQTAQRRGMPIVALETIGQQIAAIAPKSQAEFEQSIDAQLLEIESGKLQTDLLQLNMAWRHNDWSAIIKMEQELTAKQPAASARLLEQRNVLMAEKIDALHQQGKRAFVAVGALHMAGRAGLPVLLKEKGYLVTFVPLRN